MIKRYLRPDYNRADQALSLDIRTQLNPVLQEVCRHRFQALQRAQDNQERLEIFREQFAALPRVALEAISREKMLPEASLNIHNVSNKKLDADLQNARAEIEEKNMLIKRQKHQLDLLYSSKSWRITAPLRSMLDRIRGIK